ncbi:MAG TPA: hypothetical protein PLE33_03065 [Candidatus Cloacimonas sp.]|nr:hypothetical protein [Candidatus Cloacimonas sp.]HPS60226.1 hypothetical protein [Candidatus Cloacimonas sp.]
MNKRQKRRVKGIAVFIVFLALAASIVQWQDKAGKHETYDFKPAQNDYRDLKFLNKAQISFSSPNIDQAKTVIDKIISEHSLKQIRKQSESSFGAYIFSVPKRDLPVIIEKLHRVGSINSQAEHIDTALVNIDYESELVRLQGYDKEQTELNNVRFPTDTQNRRKEELHSLIQNTRSNLDKLKEADNVLLFITLVPQQKTSSIEVTIKSLALIFINWLIIFAVGAVLIYYGTRLLMYFLSALGVKGIGAGGLGSSYRYGGYGGYYNRYYNRYNYGHGKRKIKRIYKDKKTTPEPEDENNIKLEEGKQ